MMKKLLLLCCCQLFLASCATVPLTGRSQFNIMPDSSMLQMSLTEYDKFLGEHKLSDNVEQTRLVKEVGANIQQAVEAYFKSRGLEQELQDYAWEFNLVESDDLNAWCMPGGKVVVYTGIMKVAENGDGLAVVMGHEIAHAIAKHGNERMSQALMVQAGETALATATQNQSAENRQLWGAAFGLGAKFGFMLPYSRLHESEADKLGLIFMTMAGYDPQAAVTFWQRMAAGNQGKTTPEFLSTHPADSRRIADIQAAIPEVIAQYGRMP